MGNFKLLSEKFKVPEWTINVFAFLTVITFIFFLAMYDKNLSLVNKDAKKARFFLYTIRFLVYAFLLFVCYTLLRLEITHLKAHLKK